MQEYIVQMAQQYPILMAFFGAVGFIRLINKPLFTFLHAVADATETQKDNQILDKVEQSKFYKGVVFALDWLFSIKTKA